MDDAQPAPDLSRPAPWRAAQAANAVAMTRAGFALGQLDADLSALPPDDRCGAIRRLALIEVAAILSASGRPIPLQEIAADLLDAAPTDDIQALRFARWAVRRLEGQGATTDLRGFLALHRSPPGAARIHGRRRAEDLDDLARDFLDHIDRSGLHPLARGPHARVLWRLAGLSPEDDGAEAAIWVARDSASACTALPFAPLGRAHLRLLVDSGPPAERMARHARWRWNRRRSRRGCIWRRSGPGTLTRWTGSRGSRAAIRAASCRFWPRIRCC
ncbi:hypothetical protein PE067_13490 [Paracoccus sp. DMF-8]|uniref:hypothetical protein n=1 Tax=Paracoccus sp. DMF-8 TaxID=3019445 RepID=UPI0023E7AE69|nr:hypothetical protein [Paracoccus sp. DMF-8]MDF3607056.1 hypothetical protein [Paracoccus sp. DMF-8]